MAGATPRAGAVAGSEEKIGTAEHKEWAGSGAAADQEEAGLYSIFRFEVIGLGHPKNASCFDTLRVLIDPSRKAQSPRTGCKRYASEVLRQQQARSRRGGWA